MLSRCYCSTQRLSKEFRERNLWRKRAFSVLILPKSQGRGSKICSGRHCKWLAFSLTISFSHPLATCIFSFAAEKVAIFLWLLSDAFKKLRKEVNCNGFQQVVRYLIIYSTSSNDGQAARSLLQTHFRVFFVRTFVKYLFLWCLSVLWTKLFSTQKVIVDRATFNRSSKTRLEIEPLTVQGLLLQLPAVSAHKQC